MACRAWAWRSISGARRGAHAANLVLQGDEGAALIAEGLDFVPQLLRCLAELGVARHLRFGLLVVHQIEGFRYAEVG